MLAEGLDRPEATSGIDAVTEVARERGTEIALEARRNAGPRPSRRRRLAALIDLLGRAPGTNRISVQATPSASGTARTTPSSNHPGLTCGMNLAWAEGVVTALDSKLRPELIPQPNHCCVVFQEMPGGP